MAPKKLPDMIEVIGACGRFQVFLTAAVYAATGSCVWGMMFLTFASFNPGWTCLDNVTTTLNTSTSSPSRPTQWSVDCSVKSSCENLIYNDESSTVATEWDLSCDSSWVLPTIISIEMAGAFVGACGSGMLGDRFGRKVSIYGHVALHAICNIVAIFSVSWQMYAVVMFFVGYAGGGLIAISYPFPLEFANEWWRAVIVAIPEWNVSFFLFALTAWALRDWEQMHIVAAILSTLAFLPVFWTPESVRWLAVRGKTKQAKMVVSRIARMNRHPAPDTRLIDDVACTEKAQAGTHTYTYIDLFRLSSLRRYSISFGIIAATLSFVYYGIAFGIRALSGDFYINLIISCVVEFQGMFFVAPALNYLGRRKAAFVFFVIVAAACFAVTLISFLSSGNFKDMSILILAVFCKMVIVAAWGTTSLYSSEVFPTVVRTTKSGYTTFVARLVSIISPFVIPNDPGKIYLSFLIMGILGLIVCGIILSLPETKGMALRDTAQMATQNDVETDDPEESV